MLIGFSIITHPFWGTPYFWKHPFDFVGKLWQIDPCENHGASFGKIRLRRIDCSKRRAESHLPDFSQDDTAALKMMTSSSHSCVLSGQHGCWVSNDFAGLPIYNLQYYLFTILHPSYLSLLRCMKPAHGNTNMVLSSSSKWSKAWCHCDARSQVLMTALWVWTPAVSRPQHILLLWFKGHSLMCKLDVARKSISKISKLQKNTKTFSPCRCISISHISLAEVLVALDDCIHLLTSRYEKSLARSQRQSSSCFDAGKLWLKQWSRPRSSTASVHRTEVRLSRWISGRKEYHLTSG